MNQIRSSKLRHFAFLKAYVKYIKAPIDFVIRLAFENNSGSVFRIPNMCFFLPLEVLTAEFVEDTLKPVATERFLKLFL